MTSHDGSHGTHRSHGSPNLEGPWRPWRQLQRASVCKNFWLLPGISGAGDLSARPCGRALTVGQLDGKVGRGPRAKGRRPEAQSKAKA